MERTSSTPTGTGEHMVTGQPMSYEPCLDPEVKVDLAGSVRDVLREDLKWWIKFDQTSIGQMTRIKEAAKDDQEILTLFEDIIQRELFLIKLSWWGINDIL